MLKVPKELFICVSSITWSGCDWWTLHIYVYVNLHKRDADLKKINICSFKRACFDCPRSWVAKPWGACENLGPLHGHTKGPIFLRQSKTFLAFNSGMWRFKFKAQSARHTCAVVVKLTPSWSFQRYKNFPRPVFLMKSNLLCTVKNWYQ
jgi:hypothetical protein